MYRTDTNYQHDETQNESRADKAEEILAEFSDKNAETDGTAGVFTDVSDVLAHFIHLCARAGLDFDEIVASAERAAQGDLEDGPEAARDDDRFPEWVDARRRRA